MLFRKAVTIRHTLLAAGAVLVLGMAVYLVREVSRTPSSASASRPQPVESEPAPPPTSPPTRAVLPREVKSPDLRPSETPPPAVPSGDVPPPLSVEVMPGATTANPKLDAVMAEANRAYDQGDFDEAKQIAQKVLTKAPGNVRMLRIVVSSECIAGDATEAQKHFAAIHSIAAATMQWA